MGRIKINLLSGNSIEKPLITAFKGVSGDYVVFDNEMSGTMGLPIILISKLEGANLTKIADKSQEWDATKEMLRQIIGGNTVEYINVPLEVSANDDFFTQLTLPINSFDLLRNNYSYTGNNMATNVAPAVAPVPEVVPQPAPAVAPTPEVVPQPAPAVAPTPEVVPQPAPAVAPTPEVVPQPAPAIEPTPEVVPQPAPAVAPTPEVVPQPVTQTSATPIDFTADKEAFLKACENMFDALVAKVNKQ